ncbi:AAA family ATPase [Kutzneria sp. NPDC051319]|uniref:ATP-binding protein n=1 Tax=Kutzneria sp. NPDC051319 TaxID=3155047 RepID=UPI003413C6FD
MAIIGRGEQIRALTDLLARTADRTPAAVMLDGDAGLGKTAVVREFARIARDSGAFVLMGSCIELIGGAIPYGPLVEALRQLVREKGSAGARQLAGPAWTELAGLIADFTVGAQPAMAEGSQLRVFGAVSRLLSHIGEQQPFVLVFEDVHWADDSTLDLIAHLVQQTVDQRVMLLCSYRSGLELRHPLRLRLADPQFVRRVHRFTLRPFNRQELRSFLCALTDSDVSMAEVDRYFDLSEGNPYFTEQLVLADNHTGQTPPVPRSIDDLMSTRLAELSADADKVVRIAAVVGRRVSDALLSRVVGLDEPAMDAALGECLAKRILVEDPDEETYTFHHALLRETAYRTVPKRARRNLHAALAAVLEEGVAANRRLLPELAYHWYAAERFPEALRTSIAAGELAVRMRAFREALAQFRRTLDLWDQLPDAETISGARRVDLLRMAADAARWAGHVRQALAWSEEAIDAVGAAEPAVIGELYERLGSYQWEAGAMVDSVESYRRARRMLGDGPPGAVGSRVYAALATAEIKSGRYSDALPLARTAIEQAEQAGALPELARARNSEGLALVHLGDYDAGVEGLRAALAIAREADHLEDMLRTYAALGVGLERANRLTEAVDVFLEGLGKADELGLADNRNAALLANNAAALLFAVGRWDEADALLEDLSGRRPSSDEVFQRLTKAELDVARGRHDDAATLLDGLRDYPENQPRFVGPLYRCLAELAVARGDAADALARVRSGIEAVTRGEDRQEMAQLCALGLRIVADQITSDARDGVDWFAAAVALAAPVRSVEAGEDEITDVLVMLCESEQARSLGTDTAAAWGEIEKAWQSLQRPHPRAYALVRQALATARDGDRARAAPLAGAAESIVVELGAEPLRALLVRETGRLRLPRKSRRRPRRSSLRPDTGAMERAGWARRGPEGGGHRP